LSQVAKLAAVSSGLPFVCITVYAATEKEAKSQLVKPDQLPMYSPPPLTSRYVAEQPGQLQRQVSALRHTASPYLGWGQSVFVFVKNGIMDSIQFGKDAYVYLKDPPPEFLPKVGVIAVAALGGAVLARKGSKFKKIAYPLGLTAVGFSVCYPAQAVVIAKVTGRKLLSAGRGACEAVRSLWAAQEGVPKVVFEGHQRLQEESAVESRSFNRTESSPVESWSNKDPVPSSGELNRPKFQADPKLMDHGQSRPEDVDMYSTRS
ncbi:MIC27 protein, partial [Calyptomena viridis]|nr:MIC27 protein [Calyptomena viridis]